MTRPLTRPDPPSPAGPAPPYLLRPSPLVQWEAAERPKWQLGSGGGGGVSSEQKRPPRSSRRRSGSRVGLRGDRRREFVLELACPVVVSCADELAFDARDATVFLSTGVPLDFAMSAGSRDGRVSLASKSVPNMTSLSSHSTSSWRDCQGARLADMGRQMAAASG